MKKNINLNYLNNLEHFSIKYSTCYMICNNFVCKVENQVLPLSINSRFNEHQIIKVQKYMKQHIQ